MEKPIYFDIDLDNKPIKDEITKDNIDSLVFKEQYRLALQQIDQYLTALTLSNNEKGDNPQAKDDYDFFDIDYNNNIFAFVGERGTGKTSCMISLADLLCSKSNRKDAFTEYPNINKVNFRTIDLIDPSYFDSTHNVISLFLAKLYDSYKKHVEKNDRKWDIDENSRTLFLNELSKTQKHLAQLDSSHKGDPYGENSIEQLVSLASAVDLKKDIRDLVDAYNEVLELKDSILVLRIDDIDLNIDNSAKMAKYIRKYFIQPNMIVLMSLKLEQLEAIKRNEFKEAYDKVADEVDTGNMAVKYMNKLIPQSQRIQMPTPRSYLEQPLVIKSKRFSKELTYYSIKLAVPELIFQKTRYLFYNSKIQNSLIIPRNLRDLRQLIKLLCLMPDYSKGNALYSNKDVFKNFFFNSWVEQHIERADQHYIKEIVNEEDILMLNSQIVHVLNNKFKVQTDSPFGNNKFVDTIQPEIDSITSFQNMSYNISAGDVLGLISALDSRHQKPHNQHFLFFIKSLYSMRMYEAYDSVTEGNADKEDEERLIYRLPLLNNLTSYNKICGGNLFNRILTPLIPDLSSENSYVSQEINGMTLIGLMKQCLSDWNNSLEAGKVMLTEFIMLSITGNNIEDYRSSADVYYNNRSLEQMLRFNLYSVFYNLTQLCVYKLEDDPLGKTTTYTWPCYNRFLGYFAYIDEYKNTANLFITKLLAHHNYSHKLWPHLMLYTLRDKQGRNDKASLENYDADDLVKDFKPERWMSYCCFRNAEILQDFAQYMSDDFYKDDSPSKIFYKFFDKVSHYTIKTYDIEEEGHPHKISFHYAECLRDIFSIEDIDEEIRNILSIKNVTDSKLSDSSSVPYDQTINDNDTFESHRD